MYTTPSLQLLVIPVLVLLSGVVWEVVAGTLWERDRKRQQNKP